MFCPNCGKELLDGSRFCGGCGAKLDLEKMSDVLKSSSASEQIESGRDHEPAGSQSTYGAADLYEAGITRNQAVENGAVDKVTDADMTDGGMADVSQSVLQQNEIWNEMRDEEPLTTLLQEEPQWSVSDEEPLTTPLQEEPQWTVSDEEPQTTPLQEEPQWTVPDDAPLMTPQQGGAQAESQYNASQATQQSAGDSGTGRTAGNKKGGLPIRILIGVAAAVVVILVVVLCMEFLPGTSADSSGDASGGILSSLMEEDTPTGIKTYIVGVSGEEELYYTASYYDDGTLAETWQDSAVYQNALDETLDYDSYFSKSTYSENGDKLSDETTITDTSDGKESQKTVSQYVYDYTYDEQGEPVSCSIDYYYYDDASITIDMKIGYADTGETAYIQCSVTYISEGMSSEGLVSFAYTEDGMISSISIAEGDYTDPEEVDSYDAVLSCTWNSDGELTEMALNDAYDGSAYSYLYIVLDCLGDTRDCSSYCTNLLAGVYDRIEIEYDENGNMAAGYAYSGTEQSVYMTVPEYEDTTDEKGRVVKRIMWYDGADSWEDAEYYLVSYLEYD